MHETPGRILLRIEPGMAFGTGRTRRQPVARRERKAFRRRELSRRRDGHGDSRHRRRETLPPGALEACDTDADAITIAHENALLNRVSERINFRVGTVEDDAFSVDCVCANLTADVIIEILPTLVGASCGRLILSGILATQTAAVLGRLAELGIDEHEITADGEWVAIAI